MFRQPSHLEYANELRDEQEYDSEEEEERELLAE